MSTNQNAVDDIPENAVRDTKGKPFIIPFEPYARRNRLVDLIREYFGRDFTLYRLQDCYCIVPVNSIIQKGLSPFERAALEGIVWYCGTYTEGFRHDAAVTLPKLIHGNSDADVIANQELTGFSDEARAITFASVVEYCFSVDAEVIEVPAGWAVTVSRKNSGITAEEVARIQGACQVVMHFPIDGYDSAAASPIPEDRCADPDVRRAWQECRNTSMDRIEAKLDALLDRLDTNTVSNHRSTARARKAVV